MYMTPDVVEQRKQILQALNLHSGDRVLDVGSGPGFLASAIGEAVGSSGWVCGIDISESLLAVAKAHCTHQSWVEFHLADATKLPFPDSHFDVVVSTQVLEYLPDVDATLTEIYRILRVGGSVVILDTDWDSLVWHTNDRTRMNHILTAWNEHTTDPHLPTKLAKRINLAGFLIEAQQIVPMFNPFFEPDSFSNRLIDLVVSFVSDRGAVTADEAREWAAELRQLGPQEEYFFSLNRYLFVARKAKIIL
jgi:arsenite methyltransferase